MLKHGDVYLAYPLRDDHSATKDIKARIENAAHIADRQGLTRVVTCLSLAMHILEEEEKKDRCGSRA